MGGITYPLLSDFYPHGQVAQAFGVLRPEGKSERAIFVLDKQGIVQYVDVHDIDQQPDNEEIFRVLGKLDPSGAPARAPEPAPSPEPTADVVMYCTSWCPACRRAREFFKTRDIAYVEVDIGRDRAAAQRVRGWANGNETTPTFNIKGTIIVNFDQDKIERALGLK
ncbi:MAG: redoxin domain-containing protein [Chloroflexi bacterium]|nr:redoxin domain-containing protein [Chloroflexota bacterium]